MNELQKYMLEKRVSLKDAIRITGKPRVYCRQAMSGQLCRDDKTDEFLASLKAYFEPSF